MGARTGGAAGDLGVACGRASRAAAAPLIGVVALAVALATAATAQSCPEIPTTCVEAESGQLSLSKRSRHKAKLKWKANALDIAIEELEDPTASSSYWFCLYAGTAERLIKGVEVSSGSQWKRGNKGYKYRDKLATAGGIEAIKSSTGSLEDAQVSVRAKGDELLELGFPFASDDFPILVQLANPSRDVCWETTFEKQNFAKNDVNRRGTMRSTAIVKPERCREDLGCAVERPLIGAALCRDRVAAGGGMAKRMKIKMGDIIRCRQREAIGKTDGSCDPGLCSYQDPACPLLDSYLRSGVLRSIGHYQTKLDLACDDVSVAAAQESTPGWGAPCAHARTVAEMMECLETGAWGEYGRTLANAVFGSEGIIATDLLRCRKEIAKQTQKYSSKFNTLLYSCRRSPIVRGRPCAEDPLVTGQTIFANYVSKLRNSCSDALVARLEFGGPCAGSTTITGLTDCLGQLARDLAYQGVALSYP